MEWVASSVALSLRDRAIQIEVSTDQLVCCGDVGGFRMIRATHGVHSGAYYYEVEILKAQSDDAHVRVGWSTRQGELQSFVGYDKYSFGYRDINGAVLSSSKRYDDYDTCGPYSGAREGDIIGCYISLDEFNPVNNHIRFYKNGIDMGIAFGMGVCTGDNNDRKFVSPGEYYPAISLYMKACVRVNFGPCYILKPVDLYSALSMSEMQPMSPVSRKFHEKSIATIQDLKGIINISTSTRALEDANMTVIEPSQLSNKEIYISVAEAESVYVRIGAWLRPLQMRPLCTLECEHVPSEYQ